MKLLISALLLVCAVGSATAAEETATRPKRKLDVWYVPTPHEIVDRMLDVAKVRAGDVVYDLGCGDGRMVIAAAKKYGTRGVGVDLDPARIREARANAKHAGVVVPRAIGSDPRDEVDRPPRRGGRALLTDCRAAAAR